MEAGAPGTLRTVTVVAAVPGATGPTLLMISQSHRKRTQLPLAREARHRLSATIRCSQRLRLLEGARGVRLALAESGVLVVAGLVGLHALAALVLLGKARLAVSEILMLPTIARAVEAVQERPVTQMNKVRAVMVLRPQSQEHR